MRRTTLTVLSIAITLMLAAPTALAAWKSYGAQEPDTTWDRDGGFMFNNPNTAKEAKAYLSVVPVFGHVTAGTGAWASPNTGTTGSRLYPAGPMQFDAIFGAWIDCNLDGYVGHIETALIEYPSQLLPANSPCLDLSLALWNQQGWVGEVRWIHNDNLGRANGANGQPRDARVIVDDNATIWGDFGVPGDTMGREVCPRPGPGGGGIPRGSTTSTGGVLNTIDCFTGHRIWQNGNPVLALAGLGFEETNEFNEAGHPLNMGTLGEDDGRDTYAPVWDCSAEREEIQTGQGEVTGSPQNHTINNQQYTVPWVTVIDEDGHLNFTLWGAGVVDGTWTPNAVVNVEPTTPRPVSPGSPNAGGSIAGTYNHTVAGNSAAGCASTARVYSNWESNAIPEKAGAKNRVTTQFVYYEEQRNGLGQRGMAWYGTQVYPVLRQLNTNGGGTHWYAANPAPSELGSAGPTPPQLVRSSDLQPEGAMYWTFYANFSVQGLSKVKLPGTAPGSYGTEWCSISADPAVNGGFVCDASKWYYAADGTRVGGQSIGGFEYAPAPGAAYHLRDVDCFDGTLVAKDPVTGTDTSIAKASLVAASTSGGCDTV